MLVDSPLGVRGDTIHVDRRRHLSPSRPAGPLPLAEKASDPTCPFGSWW